MAMSLISPSAHATVVARPNATSASRIASAIRFIDLTSLLAIEMRPAWARVAPTFVGGESDDGAANHSCGLSESSGCLRSQGPATCDKGHDLDVGARRWRRRRPLERPDVSGVVGRARASPEVLPYILRAESEGR